MVELNQRVVDWCRGPLAVLTDGAIADPRVKVVVDDVSRVIARAPAESYHAIILDLYEGPHAATNRTWDPLYGAPFDIGILHYASDTPLSKGKNLGAGAP